MIYANFTRENPAKVRIRAEGIPGGPATLQWLMMSSHISAPNKVSIPDGVENLENLLD